MRVAYLILAHEKPAQLARLVSALTADGVGVFVHVDQASLLDDFTDSVGNAPYVEWARQRVDVHWGGFGVVQATLNLMSQASAKGSYDYFILLSGVDYPIASHARLVAELSSAEGAEFINCRRMPAPDIDKPMSRLDRYFIAPKNRRNAIARLLNRALLIGPRRNVRRALGSMQPYAGSGWWCLSHACVDYIISFTEANPDFVNFFRRSRIPDEMFFQTIVGNSDFGQRIRPALFYADWSRKAPPFPSVLDRGDLDYLRDSGKLFARKFDLELDHEIFDLIDRDLRGLSGTIRNNIECEHSLTEP
jgi:hypothetical protein